MCVIYRKNSWHSIWPFWMLQRLMTQISSAQVAALENTMLIKLMYGDTRYKVKLNGKFSNSCLVKHGLQQGSPAACLSFTILFAMRIHVVRAQLEHKGSELRFRMNGNIFDIKRLKANSKSTIKLF